MGDGPDQITNAEGTSSPYIPDFSVITVADSAVERFNREGFTQEPRYDFMRLINNSQTALNEMPSGKQGIVLGSGENSASWHTRGWKTLDSNPSAGAVYTHDVNHMDEVVPANSQDYLFAEQLTLDRNGDVGGGWGRLPLEANHVLKTGGVLIMRTGSVENMPNAGLPTRRRFTEILAGHGFKTTAVVSEIKETRENLRRVKRQFVWYYAQKIADGFNPARAVQVT